MTWRGRMIGGSLIAAVCALGAFVPASAQADTPITGFTTVPSNTQAGGHPDIEVTFQVSNTVDQDTQSSCNCENAKDATVQLPAGFIGNPHATPQCTLSEFAVDACPIDSQVGIVDIEASGLGFTFNAALYNMIPAPGEAGLLAFKLFFVNAPQFTVLNSRTNSDYGLEAKNTSIIQEPPLHEFREVLWGVPADPSHDAFRLDRSFTPGEQSAYLGNFCDAEGHVSTTDPNTVVQPCELNLIHSLPPAPSNSPLTPFLQSPTTCNQPLSSSLTILSYDGGTTEASDPWPEMTGCDQLSFNPSLYAHPTTEDTDTPSGIDIELGVPQQLSPVVPSPTELRNAEVTLPTGFSINPNAADGKTACTDAEAMFGTKDEAHCPEFSKIGSLEIDSSALPGPVPGFVYLGQPLPGNRYRVFLTADGFNTHIKLAGMATPDRVTGQLTISFKDLPQSPLTSFKLHLFGSERGLLATPDKCGTYPVSSTFVPWDASLPAQTSTQFFTLDSGPNGKPCPGATRPFHPTFEGASASNAAGSDTSFSVTFGREDGDQNLTGVSVKTPPGFTAKLAGIPYCPYSAISQLESTQYSGLAEIASSACPAASQIGTVVTGSGAGNHPLYLPGKVYLAGPYKGAPLSLVVVIPAVSGPYDLGNVAVRAAINVDPLTGQVTTVSDPLPQIREGILLRTRFIRVVLSKAGFARNPTNCEPLAVDSQLTGDEGAVAGAQQHFQVSDCARLPFAPKLSLKLTGGVNRLGHPAIHSVFSTQPGEANSRRIAVTLSSNELLDQGHLGSVCTRPAFAADTCPPSSEIGNAEVDTPLLDEPLVGTVYLRSSSEGLPDLAIDLHGQLHIEAIARVDAVNGGLRTTFRTVPDLPLGTVHLDLDGGAKGLIQNSEPLCGAREFASLRTTGQNGVVSTRRIRVHSTCGAGKRSKRHAARKHHRNGTGRQRGQQ